MMKKFRYLLLFAVLLLSSGLVAADSVTALPEKIPSIDGKLTLEDCIVIALSNSPSAESARIAVQDAQVSLSMARNVLLPTASASAQGNYKAGRAPGVSWHDNADANSSLDATLSISGITDIVRDIKVQKLALEQALLQEETVKNTIVANVSTDYYALLSAKRAVGIRTKSRDLYQDQFNRSTAYFEQGIRPKVDVTTAEVNLNNEILSLIRAKNLVLSSSAKLANTMGITTKKVLDIEEADIDSVLSFSVAFDQALNTAYQNRPDVLSMQTGLEMENIRLNKAKFGYFPTLSVGGSYSKFGDDFHFDNDDARLFAAIEVPIFSAFKNTNNVKKAKLAVESVKNNHRSLLNNVFLEVQSAFIKFREAAESIPVAKLNVERAQENLDLAQGRYNEGISDIIELRDAEVSYTNSELNYLTARYDYAVAIAEIKKAMGTR